MARSELVVARTTLYEQVWTTPMMKLAVEYRITGTGLAKICRRGNIPVPPRGYWNKLHYGKPVMKRPPLPPAASGRGDMISVQPSNPPHGIDPFVEARAAVEHQPENRIEVSDQLRRPHPLIQDANALLAKAPKNEHGIANVRSGTKTAPAVLDIRVSPAARSRALRLLDALLKALEARGYSVSARGVTIEGELVPIGVMEKDDRMPHVATIAELARKRQYSWEHIPTWDYAPGGRLSIFIDAYVWWRKDLRKRWSDRRSVRLEDTLNEVVIGLVAIGVALRQRADEQRREAEMRAEQERRRQELARQARMERARQENLITETAAWTQAKRIRELVAVVRRRTATELNFDANEIESWIAWATRVASDLDPLAGGLQRLLAKHQRVAEEAGKPESRNPYGYGYHTA